MSATAIQNFTVDATSGITEILRTRKAKGCNLKVCNLPRENSFHEHFRTFPKHLSNIVWSLNLTALQTESGEPAASIKWKFFKSSRVGDLLPVTYR